MPQYKLYELCIGLYIFIVAGLLIEGIKKFAGEIIGVLMLAVLMLAVFLYCFPSLRSLFTDYNLPGNSETQRELELHRQEEERLKAELKRKEEALKEAEEARQRAEAQRTVTEKPKPTPAPKLPAMSDSDFLNLCESGNTAEIEAAIKNGANVNAKYNDGMTALMLAARYGHAEIAELLLKYGANVNAKEYDGSTALIWAAINGQTETAGLLLKYGAEVNARNNKGWTALRWARDEKTRHFLRKYGATK